MRRFLGILLLLSIGIPSAGTFFWLSHTKKRIRNEKKWKMIEGLNRNEPLLLKFSESETRSVLKWKHSKEFEFKGQIYDIVETEFIGDSVSYWRWFDHKETQLNKQLKALVAYAMGRNQAAKESSRLLIDFLKILYYTEPLPFLNIHNVLAYKYQWAHLLIYNSVKTNPPVPPPKKVQALCFVCLSAT